MCNLARSLRSARHDVEHHQGTLLRRLAGAQAINRPGEVIRSPFSTLNTTVTITRPHTGHGLLGCRTRSVLHVWQCRSLGFALSGGRVVNAPPSPARGLRPSRPDATVVRV